MKTYEELVELAKKEIIAIEGHEIRICELAMQVVTIRHGGRSNGYYTVTDFAKDIGMSHKTLQNWLLTYRNVVMKLDKKISTSKEFKNARKVEEYLRTERTLKNQIAQKPPGTRHAYNSPVPEEKVRSIYKTLEHGDKPFEGEFAGMIRGAKHIKHLLTTRDLRIIPDDQLLQLMTILDEASELINIYLTNKKRNQGRAA